MNTSKIIILNGENISENDINIPVLISINDSGLIKLSREKENSNNYELEKKHGDWSVLWYKTKKINQCESFQDDICSLLSKEETPPLVFIDKGSKDLIDLNLVKSDDWKNETLGNYFKINPRLADELNRLNATGIPVNTNDNNDLKWLNRFKVINNALNYWICYQKRLDEHKIFELLSPIWHQGFKYYQSY